MRLRKIGAKPQGFIHRCITQSASLWCVIDPINVETVVSLRNQAVRDREFAVLLDRFF
jgi:hypothetical protein